MVRRTVKNIRRFGSSLEKHVQAVPTSPSNRPSSIGYIIGALYIYLSVRTKPYCSYYYLLIYGYWYSILFRPIAPAPSLLQAVLLCLLRRGRYSNSFRTSTQRSTGTSPVTCPRFCRLTSKSPLLVSPGLNHSLRPSLGQVVSGF